MFQAVAVDIDGTFLNDQRDYDRQLFARVWEKLQQHHIHFIVASGDQYTFLKSLFPDRFEEISFVAENGVLVIDRHQEEVSSGLIRPASVAKIVNFLLQQPATYFTMCVRQSAYVFNDMPAQQLASFRQYYTNLQTVAGLPAIHEDIFKFALTCPPQQTMAMVDKISQQFAGIIQPTVSGYGAIDLIIPHMNKGHGLRQLLSRWHLSANNLLVFGDNENDLSMFEITLSKTI